MARKGPDTPWEDLTPKQRALVIHMAEHGCSTWNAAAAGVVSRSSVEKWGVANIQGWLATYQAAQPPTPSQLAEHARAQLRAMLADSLGVIHNTLARGEGDATAVKTARWIVEGVMAEAAPAPAPARQPGLGTTEAEDAAELAAVLKLVTG